MCDHFDSRWNYTIEDVKFTVNSLLNKINPKQSNQDGRIGPAETVFDTETKNRHITFSADKLTATCTLPKGSGTAKANTALYKGRYLRNIGLILFEKKPIFCGSYNMKKGEGGVLLLT